MTRRRNRATSIETLHAEAVTDLEVLLHSAAALRAELRSFETSLRKARAHLARGGAAAELNVVIDIVAIREALSRAATDFEAARRVSRISIFRAQAAEGMSIGAIARAWGLSRQLVSRLLKEPHPNADNIEPRVPTRDERRAASGWDT
jgi:hypothetical protein